MTDEQKNSGIENLNLEDGKTEASVWMEPELPPVEKKKRSPRRKYKVKKELAKHEPKFLERIMRGRNIDFICRAEVLAKNVTRPTPRIEDELWPIFKRLKEDLNAEPFLSNMLSQYTKYDKELKETHYWRKKNMSIPRVQDWEKESNIRFLYKLFVRVYDEGIMWHNIHECVTLIENKKTKELRVIDGRNRFMINEILTSKKFEATIFRLEKK